MSKDNGEQRSRWSYCVECQNRSTPLCDSCAYIHKPSGAETRPTRYVGATVEDGAVRRAAALAAHIEACVRSGQPIRTAYVLMYNQLLTQKQEDEA